MVPWNRLARGQMSLNDQRSKMNIKIFTIWLLLLVFPQTCFARDVFIPKEGKLLILGQQIEFIEEYIKDFKEVPAGFIRK